MGNQCLACQKQTQQKPDEVRKPPSIVETLANEEEVDVEPVVNETIKRSVIEQKNPQQSFVEQSQFKKSMIDETCFAKVPHKMSMVSQEGQEIIVDQNEESRFVTHVKNVSIADDTQHFMLPKSRNSILDRVPKKSCLKRTTSVINQHQHSILLRHQNTLNGGNLLVNGEDATLQRMAEMSDELADENCYTEHENFLTLDNGAAIKLDRLPIVSDDYKVTESMNYFEWRLPDEALLQMDWFNEKIYQKGFVTRIESYHSYNDLLALRLSFNDGNQETKTPFFGVNLDHQYSGDPSLEDNSLQEVTVKYIKRKIFQVSRKITSQKAARPKNSDWRTTNLILNDDQHKFRFGVKKNLYGSLATNEVFTDYLPEFCQVIGVHGFMAQKGRFEHIVAFNFIVAELVVLDQSGEPAIMYQEDQHLVL